LVAAAAVSACAATVAVASRSAYSGDSSAIRFGAAGTAFCIETSVGQIPSTVTAAALSGADVTSTTRPVRLTGARCSVTVPRFAGKNASG